MHTFRKYISNRGSALFMVISTMTALMITCMAMYFTVVAARSTTFAIFNQKQSYQNSLSIFDMLLNDAQNEHSDFRDMMLDMEIGDEISTSGSDKYLGDYVISVKRLENQKEGGVLNHVFDIIVTTTVKGVSETVHSQTYYQPPSVKDEILENPNISMSPTFAATGYVPNDVYLDRGRFYCDVYFDNEITYFGAYDGSQLFNHGDINCAGSVVFRDGKSWFPDSKTNSPIVFAVRNNLTMKDSSINMKSTDKILVGGNLYLGSEIHNAEIYVNGDLYLTKQNQSCKFFVNGNIYVECFSNPSNYVWCNGTIYDSNNKITKQDTWDNYAKTNKNILSYNDMILELDRRTQTNPYYKWTISDDVVNLDKTIGNHQKLTVEASNKPLYIVHQDAYSTNNAAYAGYNDEENDKKWKNGCVIEDIDVSAVYDHAFIIIDTGDNPDNVYTIRVKPNRYDNKGNKNVFSWTGSQADSIRVRVLVKGRGSVVIDVPDGVTYQDTDFSVMAHYNWWIICGGQKPENYGPYDTSAGTVQMSPDTLSKYLHSKCGSGCTSCHYEVTTSTETCTREVSDGKGGTKICSDRDGDGVVEYKKVIKCKDHGYEATYCPYCESHLIKDIKGDYNLCKDHVDTKAVLSKFNNSSNKDQWNKDQSGNVIYPTSNIYLVSSAESADFRFGRKLDNTYITWNCMIGYIYAPYMTFFGAGGDAGNAVVKFMGGMTVSDYNFFSEASFLMCVPDNNPAELMDPECLKHRYTAVKDWKITLKTH